MDLDVYRRRLRSASKSEALVKTSIKQVKRIIKDSPNYKTIIIDDGKEYIEKEARVNTIKEEEKELLLNPEEEITKGFVVKYDDNDWLVTSFIPNRIYPKARMMLCNQVLRWNDGNIIHESPCVAKGKGYNLYEDDDYIVTAEGEITVLTPYNEETKSIKETQRFILNDNAYKVTGIDNITHIIGDSGILQINLERVSKSEEDDTVSDVADNKVDNGWGGGW